MRVFQIKVKKESKNKNKGRKWKKKYGSPEINQLCRYFIFSLKENKINEKYF